MQIADYNDSSSTKSGTKYGSASKLYLRILASGITIAVLNEANTNGMIGLESDLSSQVLPILIKTASDILDQDQRKLVRNFCLVLCHTVATRILSGPPPLHLRIWVIPDSLLDHEDKLIHPVLQYPAQWSTGDPTWPRVTTTSHFATDSLRIFPTLRPRTSRYFSLVPMRPARNL